MERPFSIAMLVHQRVIIYSQMIFRKVSCLLGLLHLTLQVLLHAVQFPGVTAAGGLAMPDANGRVSNGAVNFMVI